MIAYRIITLFLEKNFVILGMKFSRLKANNPNSEPMAKSEATEKVEYRTRLELSAFMNLNIVDRMIISMSKMYTFCFFIKATIGAETM